MLWDLTVCEHNRFHVRESVSVFGNNLVDSRWSCGVQDERARPMPRAQGSGPDLTHAFLALILVGSILLIGALLLLV